MDLSPEQLEELSTVLQKFPESEREQKKQEIIEQLEEQQAQPQQCPFCLMVQKQIKTSNVYEDEDFLAVLEINPANLGHIILFPKKHIQTLTELMEVEQQQFYEIARKLNVSLLKLFEGSSIVFSSGKVTGVKFQHLMFNIMPRIAGDQIFLTWKPKKTSPEELELIQKKIIENIPVKQIEEKPAEPLNPESLKASFERLMKRKA